MQIEIPPSDHKNIVWVCSQLKDLKWLINSQTAFAMWKNSWYEKKNLLMILWKLHTMRNDFSSILLFLLKPQNFLQKESRWLQYAKSWLCMTKRYFTIKAFKVVTRKAVKNASYCHAFNAITQLHAITVNTFFRCLFLFLSVCFFGLTNIWLHLT